MVVDDGSVMLPPGEGKTVSFSGNRVTLIHGHPGWAYSVVVVLIAVAGPGLAKGPQPEALPKAH